MVNISDQNIGEMWSRLIFLVFLLGCGRIIL